MTDAMVRAAAHDHTWELLCVDFDGAVPVRELGCTSCSAVTFSEEDSSPSPRVG